MGRGGGVKREGTETRDMKVEGAWRQKGTSKRNVGQEKRVEDGLSQWPSRCYDKIP